MTETKRVSIRVTCEQFKQIENIANNYGLKQSHLLQQALGVGIQQLLRIYHPDQTIADDTWAKLFKFMGVSPEDQVKVMNVIDEGKIASK